MGFDTGLMKITVLFPCNTDKKRYSHVPAWRGQSSKSLCSVHLKRSPRGYARAYMCPLSILSFTNGPLPPYHVASAGDACAFAVLHAFLYAL